MKTLLTCCAALLFCVAATASDNTQITAQLTDLNARLQVATKTHDVKTIDTMLSDDYTLTVDTGETWGRARFLKAVADPAVEWIANEPSDVEVRSYNGNTALVIALLHIEFKYDGKLYNVIDRFTDVWVKDGETWRYVRGQATIYKKLT